MLKRMIAIQSSNPKTLGLTLPEWVIGGLPMPLYVLFITGWWLVLWVLIHFFILLIFGQVVKKLGENIVPILIENRKIDDIIKGTSESPLPISEPENVQELM